MMKKALECALILTRKHQLLGDKIALSTDYLKKIEDYIKEITGD